MNTFDPESIAANRRGQIAPQQRAAFSYRARTGKPQLVVIFAITLLLFGVLTLTATQAKYKSLNDLVGVFAIIIVIMGFLVVPFVWDALRTKRVQAELDEGRVEQADGEVIWKWGKFVAEIPGRRLRPIYGQTLNLLPGPHRFFYLPRTGSLLSTELLGSANYGQGTRDLLDRLARTHHFSPDALPVNHAGRLADSQSTWLVFLAVLHFVGGLAAFGAAAWLIYIYSATAKRSDPVLTVIIMTLFPGAVGLYLFQRTFKIVADVWAGQVAHAQGHVRKTVSRGRSTSYYYWIESLRFRVSGQAYNALVEGIEYRIYYAPRSKLLVGIEPIG